MPLKGGGLAVVRRVPIDDELVLNNEGRGSRPAWFAGPREMTPEEVEDERAEGEEARMIMRANGLDVMAGGHSGKCG